MPVSSKGGLCSRKEINQKLRDGVRSCGFCIFVIQRGAVVNYLKL